MKSLLHSVITIILCATAFWGCSDNNEPNLSDNKQYSMVTFQEENNNGSIFTYQTSENSPLITLRTSTATNLNVKKGTRVMLYYWVTNKNSDTDLNISIDFTLSVLFDSLRMATKANIDIAPSNPIKLKSIWRTGDFINYSGALQYTGSPRQFYLVMDQATMENDTIKAYLIDNIMGHDGYFYRKAFGSFFVGYISQKSKCKVFRVYVNDENYPSVKYYDFNN